MESGPTEITRTEGAVVILVGSDSIAVAETIAERFVEAKQLSTAIACRSPTFQRKVELSH